MYNNIVVSKVSIIEEIIVCSPNAISKVKKSKYKETEERRMVDK